MKVSLRLKLLAKPSLPNIHFYFLPNLADHGFQIISIYQISKIRKLELDTCMYIPNHPISKINIYHANLNIPRWWGDLIGFWPCSPVNNLSFQLIGIQRDDGWLRASVHPRISRSQKKTNVCSKETWFHDVYNLDTTVLNVILCNSTIVCWLNIKSYLIYWYSIVVANLSTNGYAAFGNDSSATRSFETNSYYEIYIEPTEILTEGQKNAKHVLVSNWYKYHVGIQKQELCSKKTRDRTM